MHYNWGVPLCIFGEGLLKGGGKTGGNKKGEGISLKTWMKRNNIHNSQICAVIF